MKSYYRPLFPNSICLCDHLTHGCNLVLFPVFCHMNPIAIHYPAYCLPTMGKSLEPPSTIDSSLSTIPSTASCFSELLWNSQYCPRTHCTIDSFFFFFFLSSKTWSKPLFAHLFSGKILPGWSFWSTDVIISYLCGCPCLDDHISQHGTYFSNDLSLARISSLLSHH